MQVSFAFVQFIILINVSDSPELVVFAIRLVNTVLGQGKFFGKIQITEEL